MAFRVKNQEDVTKPWEILQHATEGWHKRYGLPASLVEATPHTPLPGDVTDIGGLNLFDVSITDPKTKQRGSVVIGFNDDQPFRYMSPSYATTSGGFIPFDYSGKTKQISLYDNIGIGGGNVVTPMDQIGMLFEAALTGGVNRGEQGTRRKTLQERINTAFDQGASGIFRDKELFVPGFGMAFNPETSNARMNALGQFISPVIQRHEDDVFGYEQSARELLASAINNRQVQGVLPYKYMPLEYKGSQVLAPQSAFGVPEFEYSGFGEPPRVGAFGAPDKNPVIGFRDINTIMQVGNGTAQPLPESPYYHPVNAVMRPGEKPEMQLFEHVAIPFSSTELPTQSGAAVERAPQGLLDYLNSSRSHIEVGYQTQKSILIPGISGIQDLFYTDDQGNKRFRLNLNPQYSPEALRSSNILEAGSSINVATLSGTSGERNLNIRTKERQAALMGFTLTIPSEFLRGSGYEDVVQNLLPQLQRQGINIATAPIGPNENQKYTLRLAANIMPFESGSTKGGPSSKVTESPIPLDMFSVHNIGAMGVPVPREGGAIDAVLPVKRVDVAMQAAFAGMDRETQLRLLQRVIGRGNKDIISSVNDYYSGLGEGQVPAMSEIANRMGIGPIDLITRMTDKIIGGGRILSGGKISTTRLAQQQAMFREYGVGRNVGWLPFDIFTKSTKEQYTSTLIQDLVKTGMSPEEATQKVNSTIAFRPERKLANGEMIYGGFSLQEYIDVANMPINKTIEYSGIFNDTESTLNEAMLTSGYISAEKFREMYPPSLNTSQKTAREIYSTYGSNLINAGQSGKYLQISDAESNVEQNVLNRGEFSNWIQLAQSRSDEPAQQIEDLRGMITERFGKGASRLGLQFIDPTGKSNAFLTSPRTTLSSDELAQEIMAGEDEDIQARSIARVSGKWMDVAGTLAGTGDLGVFNRAKADYTKYISRFVNAKANVQTQVGAYGAYGVSGVLQNGEIAISGQMEERLYRLMGGTSKKGYQNFIKQLSLPSLAMVERQPILSMGTQDYKGNVLQMSLLTEQNSPVARYLFARSRDLGIRSQDVFMSPAVKSFFGDADADKVGIAPLIALAVGGGGQGTQELWERFVGAKGDIGSEIEKVLAETSPEKQQAVMDLVGVADPYSEARINAVMGVFGKGLGGTLLEKRALEDTAESFASDINTVNEQKSAMGNVYNQLERAVKVGAIYSGREAESVANLIANVGAGPYGSAVDKKYTLQPVVNLLKTAYLSKNQYGGLQVGFNKSMGIGADFENGFFVDRRAGLNNVFSSLVTEMLGSNDKINDLGFASLINTKFPQREGTLSPEESNELGIKQIQSDQRLAGVIKGIRGMSDTNRYAAVKRLVEHGNIGMDSALGTAFGARLSSWWEKNKASTNEADVKKVAKLREAAQGSGIDIDELLSGYTGASGTFEMSKRKGGGYTDPLNLVDTLWEGLQANPDDKYLDAKASFFGNLIGAHYANENGQKVLKIDSTGTTIHNQRELEEWKAQTVQRNQMASSEDPTQVSGEIPHVESGAPVRPPVSSGGGGSQPPVVPPTSVGGASVPLPSSNGGNRFQRPFNKYNYNQPYIEHLTRNFDYQMMASNEFESLHNIGLSKSDPSFMQTGEGSEYTTPMFRFEQLTNTKDRGRVLAYLNTNPEYRKQLRALRGMAKDAPFVFQDALKLEGDAPGGHSMTWMMSGALAGNEQALTELEKSYPKLAGILPLANVYTGKNSVYQDEARSIDTIVRTNRAETMYYDAMKQQILNPSVAAQTDVLRKRAGLLETKIPDMVDAISQYETSLGLPANYRLSGIDNKQDAESFRYQIDNLKYKVQKSKSLSPEQKSGFFAMMTEFGEDYKKIVGDADLLRTQADNPSVIVDSMKERIAMQATTDSAQFTRKVAEFTEALDKHATPALKEFGKELKDGTAEQRSHIESLKKTVSSIESAGRELLGGKGTGGLFTEQEVSKLGATSKGAELLSDWTKARGQLTEAEEETGTPSRVGSLARKLLGGFGLMYMRSVANIIGSGGEFGYAESVALNTSLQGALAQGMGAGYAGAYTPEDNLAGAKAMYGGGGKRAIDAAYLSLLRNNPGLVNTGQAAIAGMGAFAATEWLGQSILPAIGVGEAGMKMLGPIGMAIGTTVGLGSAVMNQIGRAQDTTTWVASNYQSMQLRGTNGGVDWGGIDRIGEGGLRDFGAKAAYTTMFELGVGRQTDFYKNMTENTRLSSLALQIDQKTNAGESREQAYKELNINKDDQFKLEKVYSYSWVTDPSTDNITQASKITAVQAWESMGGKVENASYSTLTALARAADSGLDMGGLAQSLVQASGMQFTEGRFNIMSALLQAYPNVTAGQFEAVNTFAAFAQQMGAGWTQWKLGTTPEEISANILGSPSAIAETPTKETPQEKVEVSVGKKPEKKKSFLEKIWDVVKWGYAALPGGPLMMQQLEFQTQVSQDLVKQEAMVAQQPVPTGQGNSMMEQMAAAITGPNASAAQMYFQTQWIMAQAGAPTSGGYTAEDFNKTLTPEQQAELSTKTQFYSATAGVLQGMQNKSGINVAPLLQRWQNLTNQGTNITGVPVTSFEQMIASPSLISMSYWYQQNLSPAQQQAFLSGSTQTMLGNIPNEYALFTGANQNQQINGLGYGVASLATPYASAQQMASNIWGANWSTNAGAAQPFINAMVNGIQINGNTYYGQYGLQAAQNQYSYKMAMASAGVQMQQAQATWAFTTGQGLSAYSGVVNPQTGEAFGDLSSTGGFWGIEDRQRVLQKQQQDYSFQQQQRQLDMSNRFYNQNATLQKRKMVTGHQNALEDFEYQQQVSDLQWGWRQEDFAENVRFMTGRDRRLAERQQKRDTISHNLDEDRLEEMKKREQENWKLENQQFELSKKQHQEQVKFQQEELDKAIQFYKKQKELEDESKELQRAYWVKQQELQKEQIGIQAAQAKVQYDLNMKMLDYQKYVDQANAYTSTLNQNLQNLVNVLLRLVGASDASVNSTSTLLQTGVSQTVTNSIPNVKIYIGDSQINDYIVGTVDGAIAQQR